MKIKKQIQTFLVLTLFILFGHTTSSASLSELDDTQAKLDTKIIRDRIRPSKRKPATNKRRDTLNNLVAKPEIKESTENLSQTEKQPVIPQRKMPAGAVKMPGMGGGMGFGNIFGSSNMFQKRQQSNIDAALAEERFEKAEQERIRLKKEEAEVRQEKERAEKERREQEKRIKQERSRIARQEAEHKRLLEEAEEKRKVEERLAKEQEELQREQEKLEQERREQENQIRLDQERIAQEELERDRLQREEEARKEEEALIKKERLEQERIAQEEKKAIEERKQEEEKERKAEEKRIKRQKKEARKQQEREMNQLKNLSYNELHHKYLTEEISEENFNFWLEKRNFCINYELPTRKINKHRDLIRSDIADEYDELSLNEIDILYRTYKAELPIDNEEYEAIQQKRNKIRNEEEFARAERDRKEHAREEERLAIEQERENKRLINFEQKLARGNEQLRKLRQENDEQQRRADAAHEKEDLRSFQKQMQTDRFISNIEETGPFVRAQNRERERNRMSENQFEEEINRKEAARVRREMAEIEMRTKQEENTETPLSPPFIVPQEEVQKREGSAVTLEKHFKGYDTHKNFRNIRKQHAEKRNRRAAEAQEAEMRLKRENEENAFLQSMWKQQAQDARAREEAWKQEVLQEQQDQELPEEIMPSFSSNASETIKQIMEHKDDLSFLLSFTHEKNGQIQNVLAFLADPDNDSEKEFFIICAALLRYHEVAAFEMLKQVPFNPSEQKIGFFMNNLMGNENFKSIDAIRKIGSIADDKLNEDATATKKALFLLQQFTIINRKGETFIAHFSKTRVSFNGYDVHSYFNQNARILFNDFFGPEAAEDMLEFYRKMRSATYKKIIINENQKYQLHDVAYWSIPKNYNTQQKNLTKERELQEKIATRAR